MGIFSFLKKNTGKSKYEAHGEALEKIAKDISYSAIKELSLRERKMVLYLADEGNEICFNHHLCDDWYYRANNPDDCYYYTFRFSKYGMRGVCGIHDKDFLTALLPYLKAQIAPRLPDYPPTEIAGEGRFVIQLGTHCTGRYRSQDDDYIPAIEMDIERIINYQSEPPTLKSW